MVSSASFMIVICLVVLVKDFWLIGFVMMLIAVLQILFICIMGALFEASSCSFSDHIYRVKWYLLRPKERRHLNLMQQLAFFPHLNTMGGLCNSNLNSFMVVRWGFVCLFN